MMEAITLMKSNQFHLSLRYEVYDKMNPKAIIFIPHSMTNAPVKISSTKYIEKVVKMM